MGGRQRQPRQVAREAWNFVENLDDEEGEEQYLLRWFDRLGGYWRDEVVAECKYSISLTMFLDEKEYRKPRKTETQCFMKQQFLVTYQGRLNSISARIGRATSLTTETALTNTRAAGLATTSRLASHSSHARSSSRR